MSVVDGEVAETDTLLSSMCETCEEQTTEWIQKSENVRDGEQPILAAIARVVAQVTRTGAVVASYEGKNGNVKTMQTVLLRVFVFARRGGS